LRPYLIAGVSMLDNNSWTTTLQLASFEGLLPSFNVTARAPRVFSDLTIGAELFTGRGVDFKAEYGVRAADQYLDQRFMLRAAAPF
jgi:hypothetical protein